jgi:membrane protein
MRSAKFKNIITFIKAVFSEFSKDKASRLSAAMAYYTIFSLAPLLIIAIAIIGLVFGREAAEGRIVERVQDLIGESGARRIQTMIISVAEPKSGILATIAGVVVLMFGAGNLFIQLHDALNTIWGVVPKPGRGIKNIIRERFLSLTLVLGTGFLLLVSLLISTGLEALSGFLAGLFPGLEYISRIIHSVVSLGVITLLFAAIYKVLPDVRIGWSDVWIGAATTALLFTVGKYFIGLYLGHSGTASVYGAAGSPIVLLLWVYYSVMIFLLGAEFTKVYANRYGSRVVPAEYAMSITEKHALPARNAPHWRPEGKRNR